MPVRLWCSWRFLTLAAATSGEWVLILTNGRAESDGYRSVVCQIRTIKRMHGWLCETGNYLYWEIKKELLWDAETKHGYSWVIFPVCSIVFNRHHEVGEEVWARYKAWTAEAGYKTVMENGNEASNGEKITQFDKPEKDATVVKTVSTSCKGPDGCANWNENCSTFARPILCHLSVRGDKIRARCAVILTKYNRRDHKLHWLNRMLPAPIDSWRHTWRNGMFQHNRRRRQDQILSEKIAFPI